MLNNVEIKRYLMVLLEFELSFFLALYTNLDKMLIFGPCFVLF